MSVAFAPGDLVREGGTREGEAARDRLAGQVEIALRVLGSGFLQTNPGLAEKIQSGELPLTSWFSELLRLVYRLIFLMVAEDRNLLHPVGSSAGARALYAGGYGLVALRTQCVRGSTWDHHHDRYEGMKVVFRGLATGANALGLPALGGLFGADQLSNLESLRLRNRAFMQAVYRLSWLREKRGVVPINWRAMKTEALGAVCETLLELQPQLADDGRALVFASDVCGQKRSQRKIAGSYYTPDSLVQALLNTALDPVLDRTELEADDPEKALLDLAVIDPACGSGRFLLAAARRIAARVARIRAVGTPSRADLRRSLRDVARCCIHGVDRNPMAVEFTRVALWIETLDPRFPLGFLNAQIRCGDALLGVFDLRVLENGIPDAAYRPLTGDDKETARYYLKTNRDARVGGGEIDFGTGNAALPEMRPLAADFSKLRALPEETIEQIGVKAARFRELREGPTFKKARAAADLYVAAFLVPKMDGVPSGSGTRTVPTTDEVWTALIQGTILQSIVAGTDTVRRARGFHWPLEFPDLLAHGGFDVVVGNPPWERIELQEQEFFAVRRPEVAGAPNKAARSRLIKALESAPEGSPERALHAAFIAAKRDSEAIRTFVCVREHDGGRYPLTGKGDVNSYALFAELFLRLARERAGVILPTGIATDATRAAFFDALVRKRWLVRLLDFENSAPLFHSVHRNFKFCLLTIGQNEGAARFAFYLTDPMQLAEPERNVTLSPEQIAAINPNSRTAPVFRCRADAQLTAKIHANAPVLIEEGKGPGGNPWGVRFMTMFHMSNDSGLFRTARQLTEARYVREGTDWVRSGHRSPQGTLESEDTDAGSLPLSGNGSHNDRYVPLYEAKMGDFFDHRAAGYSQRGDERGYRILPETTLEEHQDPGFEPDPFYWVPDHEVNRRLQNAGCGRDWLLGFRNVTAPVNTRTFVCSVLPKWGLGNSMPAVLLPEHVQGALIAGFVSNMSSLVFDFVARQKVGGINLNFFYVRQFPVFRPEFYRELRLAFLVSRFLEMTYTSHALTPLARDLGYGGPPFSWDDERRAHLQADLDAFYARAYGLTRDELRYILDPTDVKGSDYPSETFRVLKAKEIRQFGEYRTRRLVLAALDRIDGRGEFKELGLC